MFWRNNTSSKAHLSVINVQAAKNKKMPNGKKKTSGRPIHQWTTENVQLITMTWNYNNEHSWQHHRNDEITYNAMVKQQMNQWRRHRRKLGKFLSSTSLHSPLLSFSPFSSFLFPPPFPVFSPPLRSRTPGSSWKAWGSTVSSPSQNWIWCNYGLKMQDPVTTILTIFPNL